VTIEEYEKGLNDFWKGALIGKRLLKRLAATASEELGESVVIEQAEVTVADRRLCVYKAVAGE
jgi:hypothetical protein